jgi:membrane protein DedA with SNARE-associated domain
MPDQVANFIEYVNNLPLFLRLLAVALATALEYVFPIFPGDTVIVLAGFLRAQGGLGIFELMLATVIGTLIGALMSYSIGAAIRRGNIGKNYLEKYASQKRLLQWKSWFNRFGYWLIVVNRFFPGIRAFFFVAAGLYKLRIFLVLFYGLISALIFNSCLFGIGYLLGNNADNIMRFLSIYSWAVYIILFLVVVIFLLFKLIRRFRA